MQRIPHQPLPFFIQAIPGSKPPEHTPGLFGIAPDLNHPAKTIPLKELESSPQ